MFKPDYYNYGLERSFEGGDLRLLLMTIYSSKFSKKLSALMLSSNIFKIKFKLDVILVIIYVYILVII